MRPRLQRADEVTQKIEKILLDTPGVSTVTAVAGYSLLTGSVASNTAFLFVSLDEWDERTGARTACQCIH